MVIVLVKLLLAPALVVSVTGAAAVGPRPRDPSAQRVVRSARLTGPPASPVPVPGTGDRSSSSRLFTRARRLAAARPQPAETPVVRPDLGRLMGHGAWT